MVSKLAATTRHSGHHFLSEKACKYSEYKMTGTESRAVRKKKDWLNPFSDKMSRVEAKIVI